MSVPFNAVQLRPDFQWIDKQGRPTQAFATYMTQVDTLLRALAGGSVGTLTNAANDAAAAKAGVAVGSLYRNGSALLVRVS